MVRSDEYGFHRERKIVIIYQNRNKHKYYARAENKYVSYRYKCECIFLIKEKKYFFTSTARYIYMLCTKDKPKTKGFRVGGKDKQKYMRPMEKNKIKPQGSRGSSNPGVRQVEFKSDSVKHDEEGSFSRVKATIPSGSLTCMSVNVPHDTAVTS